MFDAVNIEMLTDLYLLGLLWQDLPLHSAESIFGIISYFHWSVILTPLPYGVSSRALIAILLLSIAAPQENRLPILPFSS